MFYRVEQRSASARNDEFRFWQPGLGNRAPVAPICLRRESIEWLNSESTPAAIDGVILVNSSLGIMRGFDQFVSLGISIGRGCDFNSRDLAS